MIHRGSRNYFKNDRKLTKLSDVLFSEFATLQQRLKGALSQTWKDAFSHDWISQQNSSLQELYTELKVTTMDTTHSNDKLEIHDILKIHNVGEEARPTKIVLEGK